MKDQRHDRDLLDVIVMVLFFVVGLFIGQNYALWSNLAKDLVGAIATLFAAFLGSWYAFRLQGEKDRRAEIAVRATSLNSAIFELMRAHNKLIALRNQFINPLRMHPDRDFMIQPVAGGSLGTMSIDYKSLGFLFLSEDPNILGTLAMLDQDFAGTLDIIAQRSRMHVEEIQPAVEAVSRANALGKVTCDQIAVELGPMKTKQLGDLSRYMVEGIDNGISATANAVRDLNRLGRPLVPGFPVLRMAKKGSENISV